MANKLMKRRFHVDSQAVIAIIAVFAVGFLLMSVPLLTSGALVKFVTSGAIIVGLLAIVWLGFTRGTYITIDGTRVYGTLFFFRGKVTQLSDVVSLHQRHTFGGLMAEVYMKYRKADGTIAERGLVSKQGIRKREFKNLLGAIRLVNQNIKIDPDLLDK
jgi:hypothetical protein